MSSPNSAAFSLACPHPTARTSAAEERRTMIRWIKPQHLRKPVRNKAGAQPARSNGNPVAKSVVSDKAASTSTSLARSASIPANQTTVTATTTKHVRADKTHDPPHNPRASPPDTRSAAPANRYEPNHSRQALRDSAPLGLACYGSPIAAMGASSKSPRRAGKPGRHTVVSRRGAEGGRTDWWLAVCWSLRSWSTRRASSLQGGPESRWRQDFRSSRSWPGRQSASERVGCLFRGDWNESASRFRALGGGSLRLVAALAADTPENHDRCDGPRPSRTGGRCGCSYRVECLQPCRAPWPRSRCRGGRIGLHRKVVALGGAVALWVAITCVSCTNGRQSRRLHRWTHDGYDRALHVYICDGRATRDAA